MFKLFNFFWCLRHGETPSKLVGIGLDTNHYAKEPRHGENLIHGTRYYGNFTGETTLKKSFVAGLLLAAASISCSAQTSTTLSPKWEELTGADFISAIHQAQGVCILPFGIIEKHGPQLPLGTDLINVLYATEQASKQEYAVLFPAYYFGQIA